jgi:hypothetical protein
MGNDEKGSKFNVGRFKVQNGTFRILCASLGREWCDNLKLLARVANVYQDPSRD